MNSTSLDAFIFYGRSIKGLSPRYCIGLNPLQNEIHVLMEKFLTQRFLFPDKNPENWHDINNDSYSIVIFTGCNSETTIEDLNSRIRTQLAIIHDVSGYTINAINI